MNHYIFLNNSFDVHPLEWYALSIYKAIVLPMQRSLVMHMNLIELLPQLLFTCFISINLSTKISLFKSEINFTLPKFKKIAMQNTSLFLVKV